MKKMTLLAILLVLAAPVFAQSDREMFAKHWKTSADFTLAVAEAMPAEAYTFAPNSEEMHFGKLMAHIAMANNMLFAAAAGIKAPEAPEKISSVYKQGGPMDKAIVVQFLKDSFEFCTKALDQIDSDKLARMSGPEGRQMSGRERLWAAFTHTAHHRGQAEVYLRVKGVKPPQYRF